MKLLLCFELKKIIKNKLILFILFVTLVLNALVIYDNDKERVSKDFIEGKTKIYERIKGRITQEKYDFLYENYIKAKNIVDTGSYETDKPSTEYYSGYVFGDMNLFHEFLEAYDYAIDYANTISSSLQLAEENLTFYQEEDDQRLNKQFIDSFKDRSISDYYETANMTKYISYDGSTILIILMLIITLSGIFSEETDYQYDKILYTTPLGTKKLYIAKFLAAAIITFSFCILYFTEDFLIYHQIGILEGFSNPIYTLPAFQYSPVPCSILTFLLLCLFAKLLCLLITAFLICLCSYFSKKVIISTTLSFIIIFLLLYVSDAAISPYQHALLKETLYEYNMLSLFHLYFSPTMAYLIFSVGKLGGLVALIFLLYKRKKKGRFI